jgi:hypothetical protein
MMEFRQNGPQLGVLGLPNELGKALDQQFALFLYQPPALLCNFSCVLPFVEGVFKVSA